MADFWQGIDGMVSAAQAAKRAKTKGAVRGLSLAVQNVLNVSNSQVPHEEGDLERDGGWSVDENKLRAAVAYGRSGDTKDYAVVQHEDMTLKHDSGRNAKYLENAFNSTRTQSAEIIAAQTRKALGS